MGYNLLIVDDEDIAIKGIVHGIEWSDMPIANIYTACDAEEAQELFGQHTIHVLLSDIDMPNQTGIELLSWVNINSPATKTILLTGHADFKYAQQALQLDGFDYLLKPVDHEHLKKTIMQAAEKVRIQEEHDSFHRTYEHYYQQWQKQLPVMAERLWEDIIHWRQSVSPQQLDPQLTLYGIPLQSESPIVVVLISIEQWQEDWSARDEEIMTYGVKNAAEEIILKDAKGQVVQDASGALLVLIYEPDAVSKAELDARCRQYIEQCGSYLHCQLSCYVGTPSPVAALREVVELLGNLERSNLTDTCTVVHEQGKDQSKRQTGLAAYPPLADWAVLLECGKRADLSARVDEFFNQLVEESDSIDYAAIVSIYFGIVHTVFQTFQRKSLSVDAAFPHREWEDGGHALKSLQGLKSWAHSVCSQGAEYIRLNGKDVSNMVRKAQQYIEEHLDEDISREQLADYVFLNPAYLSRLFRKETGSSITDYTTERRMMKAKAELENSNVKISDIATSVGYSNFSHFSKLFKKATGLTPQEYRRLIHHVD
ncbi:two-component system response regulator YesN [Paenibacillus cellulosilyticus]|uniref:Two-component system response regulator YesN n=1 Tax=Paenibacillus cellulosilyticus TaxID=375489 RepID=A0A2V2YC43_9BACL|nr:helix-turn-helix domain-containing protein [Paenibacillus cellulosilyticus]PWV89374.1 two-component system response regulator YesN [Paenibacillus cellulosilyticus]QKS47324.1 helix-turn-helix domain-containing protein [Paenibacillus cellulosilyticus]